MKQPFTFTKVQSLGNDFVLVELSDVDEADLPEIARQTADRHFAVGSDGLLAIGRARAGQLILRMFNTDGSEDFCGNGIRCAALYGYRKGWSGSHATISHHGQTVRTTVMEGDFVRSEFEPASFDPKRVPISSDGELFWGNLDVLGERITASAVTTGSTHTVIFVENLPDDETFFRLGPAIECLPIFPQRTSVIWARPEGDSVHIRIWERGVGETMGCGTGSSAAAVVYRRAVEEGKLPPFALASNQAEPNSQAPKSEFAKPQPIYLFNRGGTVEVLMNSPNAPIITTAVAEILYTAKY